jgi:signal transduction histidine kinase
MKPLARSDSQQGPPMLKRTNDARPPPSRLVTRTFVALLVVPWLFVIIEATLQSHEIKSYGFTGELFWLAFVLFTISGGATAVAIIRRARGFEATREDERLLFANARDAMLLIRVHANPPGCSEPFSFMITSENPAAVDRLRAFCIGPTYVGRSIAEVFPDWLKSTVQVEYAACAQAGEIRRYFISPPDGSPVHESIATPVFDKTGGQVTHIIIIMRDIADRMRNERELAEALRRAELASTSKSQFLASMSHELRTPLNAILGYSEMLALGIGGSLSTKQKEYAQYIHQSGSHLLGIIGDILDLSKIEAGQFVLYDEETPIAPLIEDCLLMVKEHASAKGLILRTEIPPCLPVLRVDPLRMKQIVLNLLSNALKFTETGSVTFTATFDEAKGLRLAVSDTGIGMTDEELATALEPFGQVQNALTKHHDGTGLGLPIARHLVELHGGTLSLTSQKGYGTTVSVTIPPARLTKINERAKSPAAA